MYKKTTFKKVTLTLTLVCSLITGNVASAGQIRVISAKTASETVQAIAVWQGAGTNISFIETGEVIQKAWLDDPSRITLDFDGQLGKEAMVVHLRRIKSINFEQLPSTPTTLLTLITQTDQGQRRRYQFRVSYGKGTRQYYGITIKPDVIQPTLASREYERQIERGLSYAKKQGWISRSQGNVAVAMRVQRFLSMLRGGMSIDEAAQRAGVSMALVNKLAQLGEFKSVTVNQRCYPWLDSDCVIVPPSSSSPVIDRPVDFQTEFMILPSFSEKTVN